MRQTQAATLWALFRPTSFCQLFRPATITTAVQPIPFSECRAGLNAIGRAVVLPIIQDAELRKRLAIIFRTRIFTAPRSNSHISIIDHNHKKIY